MFLQSKRTRLTGYRIVIQCAKRKNPAAGPLIDAQGLPQRIPLSAHAEPALRAAKAQIEARQQDPRLCPAGRLYAQDIYRRAIDHCGAGSVFILSALWGIVRSDYRLPTYDASFSNKAPPEAKIPADMPLYRPFQHLQPDDGRPVILFAAPAYLPLFFYLTEGLQATRVVFLRNGEGGPVPRGVLALDYPATARTNWHLLALKRFLGLPGEIRNEA